ncbi:MAG: methyltransferase domain-containing protein [Ferruginibacter sp.]|nr:methyltransferase domain-containing protein [Ferruginibacter sp.]
MSKEYWNNLYDKDEVGWDIGFPSPAIKEYIDQLTNKGISILIPGCGNAYEAEYLIAQGFTNVTVIDIAPSLTAALESKFKNENGKTIKIITDDFFNHNGAYNLIIEQTFLSALSPSVRPQYVDKMHSLLVKGGHLTGILFGRVFEEEGPPYGGTPQEYKQMFSKKFKIKKLEPCYNSIERRKGSEVFINLIAK